MDLLESAKRPLTSEAELCLKISCCNECLQLSSDKVERSTENLDGGIDSNDIVQTNQLIIENESICDKALEIVLNFKESKEK